MKNLLQRKETIFLGFSLLLILASRVNGGYYFSLNKPWFALPLLGIYFLFVLIGLSILRSYKVFLNLQETKATVKLTTYFNILWVSYFLGFGMIITLRFNQLFLLIAFFILGSIFTLVYKSYDIESKIARKLNGAIFILLYIMVIGLYIATNN